MLKRMALLALCLFGLSGCILQSDRPLFSDKDATLVLGDGGMAKMEYLDDGNWVADKGSIQLVAKSGHYDLEVDTSNVVVHFVSIGSDTYIIQTTAESQLSSYAIAEVKDGKVLFRPLTCKDVKQEIKVSRWIKYDGDNCSVPLGSPAKFIFKALSESKGEFTTRFSIIPQ